MKTLFFMIMLFTLNNVLIAQVKPIKKISSGVVKKKAPASIHPVGMMQKKVISPADTATVPENNVNPSKMQLPKTVGPSTIKLNNSVIKTPVYNNMVTGTNAPGDVNTGLPPDNTLNHPPENNSLNQVKAIRDSAAQPH